MFSEKNNITDGLGRGCMLGDKRGIRLLADLNIITSKKYETLKKTNLCEGKKIRFKCLDDVVTLNLDGELIRNVKEASAYIVNKGIKLVVPKGVKQ